MLGMLKNIDANSYILSSVGVCGKFFICVDSNFW
jgi:hypothetical protein